MDIRELSSHVENYNALINQKRKKKKEKTNKNKKKKNKKKTSIKENQELKFGSITFKVAYIL